MSFPRNSLAAFLSFARSHLYKVFSNKGLKANIVIGNESADLDSLTSALLYAYVRSTQPPKDAFSPIYIPILNLPRSEIRLRPEFAVACQYANVPVSSLLTLDDLPTDHLSTDSLRFTLVDHNKLHGQLVDTCSDLITAIIDHHEDEKSISLAGNVEPRIIQTAGSCTSLVAQYCKPTWDAIAGLSRSVGAAHGQGDWAISDSAFTQTWDAQIAKMALASILIDTTNLAAKDKVKDVDRSMVQYLEDKIYMSPRDGSSYDRDSTFDKINSAKSNMDALTFQEVLRKDYKQWTERGLTLGISSAVISLEQLISKGQSSIDEDLAEFMQLKDLNLLAIMTVIPGTGDGGFRRQLLLQSRAKGVRCAMNFVEQAQPQLDLQEDLDLGPSVEKDTDPSANMWRCYWRQGNTSKSRKQVAPLLRKAMRED